MSGQITTAGFRLLLERGHRVAIRELAAAMRTTEAEAESQIQVQLGRGAARVDDAGRLVAVAGLSVVQDRHEIAVAGRRFWTWCAFDAVGILAALDADSVIRTKDPQSGKDLELTLVKGRPTGSEVLFLPEASTSSCASVIDEWCPNANLFDSRTDAEAWADEHGVAGRVLELDEAAELGAANWRPLLPIRIDTSR